MLKFNNSHIFTGYLKQLLASTNLPTYKIYTKAHRLYHELYGVESPEILETIPTTTYKYKDHIRYIPYIKEGKVMEYIYDEDPTSTNSENAKGRYYWHTIDNYYPDKLSLNNTKTLRITNNIYDTYTHEYLGNYLRYLRDYYDLDLMSMYNCFSNKICQNLYIECLHKINETEIKQHFLFNANDNRYKIYMVPVKFYKEYTIAIDCDTEVEFCCGIYNTYQDTTFDSYNNLPHTTYQRYGQLKFNQPILYSPLKDIHTFLTKESLIELAAREDDLKLFIKLPLHNNSSITILEGNYLSYNDKFTKHVADRTNGKLTYPWKELRNHCVTNYAGQTSQIISEVEYEKTRNFKPISALQLLTANTGISYPFADKLIEYLSMNVITHLDQVEDNITRTQTVIADGTGGQITNETGVWSSRFRPVLYDYMMNNNQIDPTILYDVLGYVDKDTEQLYSAQVQNSQTKRFEPHSIANIDIYPDLYKNMKQED